MHTEPETIKPNQIAELIAERFKGRESVTCYLSSNAATPTTSALH
jgi:hypothetical protein